MAKNKDLQSAARAKKNEFYTMLTDIEKEMRYYRKQFRNKVVFCNCDDPFESNFFRYFVLNFNRLKLKQLICTCYAGSPIMGDQISISELLDRPEIPQNTPYKAIVNRVYDITGDGAVDMLDVAELFKTGENELTELQGDGDFRSYECIELLKKADIVVTNPPFSLFREYIAQLVEYDKEFLIIGSINAVTYRDFFPLIKDNKIWIGASIHSGDRAFYVPDDYPLTASGCGIDEETGRKFVKVKGVRWYTNLDLKQRHEELILTKKYNPEEYPTYENYDAIEVNKTANIPYDYSGTMGVPITFLDKYNPDQFEIIGMAHGDAGVALGLKPYDRTLKKLNKGLRDGDLYYMKDGVPVLPYRRILIRNRHPEESKK